MAITPYHQAYEAKAQAYTPMQEYVSQYVPLPEQAAAGVLGKRQQQYDEVEVYEGELQTVYDDLHALSELETVGGVGPDGQPIRVSVDDAQRLNAEKQFIESELARLNDEFVDKGSTEYRKEVAKLGRRARGFREGAGAQMEKHYQSYNALRGSLKDADDGTSLQGRYLDVNRNIMRAQLQGSTLGMEFTPDQNRVGEFVDYQESVDGMVKGIKELARGLDPKKTPFAHVGDKGFYREITKYDVESIPEEKIRATVLRGLNGSKVENGLKREVRQQAEMLKTQAELQGVSFEEAMGMSEEEFIETGLEDRKNSLADMAVSKYLMEDIDVNKSVSNKNKWELRAGGYIQPARKGNTMFGRRAGKNIKPGDGEELINSRKEAVTRKKELDSQAKALFGYEDSDLSAPSGSEIYQDLKTKNGDKPLNEWVDKDGNKLGEEQMTALQEIRQNDLQIENLEHQAYDVLERKEKDVLKNTPAFTAHFEEMAQNAPPFAQGLVESIKNYTLERAKRSAVVSNMHSGAGPFGQDTLNQAPSSSEAKALEQEVLTQIDELMQTEEGRKWFAEYRSSSMNDLMLDYENGAVNGAEALLFGPSWLYGVEKALFNSEALYSISDSYHDALLSEEQAFEVAAPTTLSVDEKAEESVLHSMTGMIKNSLLENANQATIIDRAGNRQQGSLVDTMRAKLEEAGVDVGNFATDAENDRELLEQMLDKGNIDLQLTTSGSGGQNILSATVQGVEGVEDFTIDFTLPLAKETVKSSSIQGIGNAIGVDKHGEAIYKTREAQQERVSGFAAMIESATTNIESQGIRNMPKGKTREVRMGPTGRSLFDVHRDENGRFKIENVKNTGYGSLLSTDKTYATFDALREATARAAAATEVYNSTLSPAEKKRQLEALGYDVE